MKTRGQANCYFIILFCFLVLPTKTYAWNPVESQHLIAPTMDSIENTRYITGGVVGTLWGFGIGHAVQGRYRQDGWKFTVGEAVGSLLLLINMGECFPENRPCGSALGINFGLEILTGFALVGGFRIWEIIDLWVAPGYQIKYGKAHSFFQHNRFYLKNYTSTNQRQALGIAWQYRF